MTDFTCLVRVQVQAGQPRVRAVLQGPDLLQSEQHGRPDRERRPPTDGRHHGVHVVRGASVLASDQAAVRLRADRAHLGQKQQANGRRRRAR